MIVISRPTIGFKIRAEIETKRESGRVCEYIVVTAEEMSELRNDLNYVDWTYRCMSNKDVRDVVARSFAPTRGVVLDSHNRNHLSCYVRAVEAGRICDVPVYVVPLSHHPLKDNT